MQVKRSHAVKVLLFAVVAVGNQIADLHRQGVAVLLQVVKIAINTRLIVFARRRCLAGREGVGGVFRDIHYRQRRDFQAFFGFAWYAAVELAKSFSVLAACGHETAIGCRNECAFRFLAQRQPA